MKKVLIIIGSFIALVLLAAIIIPIVFKDEIKAKVDKEISKNINAHVYFDAENFGVTLFRNFPNLTASLNDFGVVGKDVFEGDTLVSVKSFRIVLNLRSILFDEKMSIDRVELVEPYINVLVLEDGTANYDIMISEEDSIEEEPSEFSLKIDSWKIRNGNIIYNDLSTNTFVVARNVDHSGSGDFTQDIYDLDTRTKVQDFTLDYDGVNYMTHKVLDLDMELEANVPESKYTFKDNTVKVNDFAFGFDGFVTMPEEGYGMDVNFKAQENTFKSFLSLVPGMYQEKFEDIEAEGNLQFEGFVKGTYNDEKNLMPAFQLKLLVNDAQFRYPDLPSTINNINVDMLVNNNDGNLEHTIVELKKFSMNLGNNPISATARIEGIERFKINSTVMAKINLADLTQMFPVDGLSLKGNYSLNMKTNGIYDQKSSRIPTIKAYMTLENGYVKSADFPIPLEQINLKANVSNNTGRMEETVISVDQVSMLMDKERLTASLHLSNLEDYTWDLKLNGGIDLNKMMQIYPIEGMKLSGKVKANIATKGKMSDVEAERYANLPTSGTMTLTNFMYEGEDFPQGLTIESADFNFTPSKIEIEKFRGKAGKTDMRINGYLSNYINYIFKENEMIKGEMDFRSSKVNVNEWMEDEDGGNSEASTGEKESSDYEVVEIPKNINFVLHSKIDEMIYDNLTMKDVQGNIIIKNGILTLDGFKFNALGGKFAMNGNYNPSNTTHPKFNFDFNVSNVSISQAYNTFNTIQTMAPVAQLVNGDFSTNFKMNGELGQDMMPKYNTLTGNGLIKIAQAVVKNSQFTSAITSATKLKNSNNSTLAALKDVVMSAELKDGRLTVDPFDVNMLGYKTKIEGSTGIDGTIDYLLNMDVPAGAAGAALNNLVSSVSGTTPSNNTNINVNLGLGGTYKKPKVRLLGSKGKESLANEAKEEVKEQVQEQVNVAKEQLEQKKEEAKKKAQEELERKKKEAEEKARQEMERKKKEAQERLKKEAEEKAKEKLKGLFGKD